MKGDKQINGALNGVIKNLLTGINQYFLHSRMAENWGHDLLKKTWMKDISDMQELLAARIAAALAIVVAGYLGINPPGFVAQVVAFAFGLAAASLFQAILMGIFSTRMNKEGAIAGMLSGLLFTFALAPTPLLPNAFGTLDAQGRSLAPRLELPNDVSLVGLPLAFAFAVLDPAAPCPVVRASSVHQTVVV